MLPGIFRQEVRFAVEDVETSFKQGAQPRSRAGGAEGATVACLESVEKTDRARNFVEASKDIPSGQIVEANGRKAQPVRRRRTRIRKGRHKCPCLSLPVQILGVRSGCCQRKNQYGGNGNQMYAAYETSEALCFGSSNIVFHAFVGRRNFH